MAVLEGNGFLDRDLAGGSDFAVRGAGDLSSAASPLSAKISSAIGPESVTLGTGRRPLPRSVDASSSGVWRRMRWRWRDWSRVPGLERDAVFTTFYFDSV